MNKKYKIMIDLKVLQDVLYDVQNVMAGYSNDDTWSDYDKQAHAELIKMQYIVEDELKISEVDKKYSGMEVSDMMKASYKAGIKDSPMAADKKCNHNPILSKMSYIFSFEEADRRMKRGQKQKQCHVCKLWFFKEEMKKATT